MALYRQTWNVAAIAVLAAGVFLAIVSSRPGDLTAVIVLSVFIGLMLVIMGVGDVPGGADFGGWQRTARIIGTTVVLGVALRGLVGTIGGSGFLLAVVLAALHPRLLTAVRARMRGETRSVAPAAPASSWRRTTAMGALVPATPPALLPAPTLTGPSVPVAAVHTSTTPELCRRWRRSFLVLQVLHAAQPADDAELARVVTDRAEVLDELAARDPRGFQRWLEAGARAASDPSRYLDLTVLPRRGGDATAA